MTTKRIVIALAVASIALAGCSSSTEEANEANTSPTTTTSTGGSSADTNNNGATTDGTETATQTAPGSETTPEPGSATAGTYLTLADYETQKDDLAAQKTVYFFHASWCPSCQAAHKNFTADGIPEGITVVNVDFDSNSDLKKKYGVTQQHTFVQIDQAGEQRGKWSGSVTGDDIAKQVS